MNGESQGGTGDGLSHTLEITKGDYSDSKKG